MYGTTAYNRTVTASPPYGGSGYTKHQSGLRPFVVFCSATVFCARKNAPHFSLSGAKKRQLQQNVRRNKPLIFSKYMS
jgi:hypothetical protein